MGNQLVLVGQYLLAQQQGEQQLVLLEQGPDHVLEEDLSEGDFDVPGPLELIRVLMGLRGLFHGNVIQLHVELEGELVHRLDVSEHHD